MDGYSQDITEEQKQKLKELFPEVFTEGKVDWDRLKATLGEHVDLGERYGLSWKGKSGVFAEIQEKVTDTLHPQPEESVDWDTTQNMFIEGDNLKALKALHKAYYGKVKMIYIDPPYNTGNDFVYNDNFKQSRRQHDAEAGVTDEEGNITRDDGLRVNTGGHKHSNWLTMMYPRLFLARNLLRQDGVIFVSIDDNEVHNLRMIMNEIFGEENFVAQIIWVKKYASANDVKNFSENHDYILAYRRSGEFTRNLLPRSEKQDSLYKYDDNDERGRWRTDNLSVRTYSANYDFPITNPNTGQEFHPPRGRSWVTNRNTVQKWIRENRIFFGKDGKGAPQLKRYLSEVQQGVVPSTVWIYDEVGHNDESRKEVKDIFGTSSYFDTPKPTRLMKRLLQIASSRNDIILDFFAGSGTLAHAVTGLNAEDGGNRKWICVQLPELTDEKSEAYKAGYKTIAEIARERIRRAGKKIAEDHKDKIAQRETPLDLGFRAYRLGDSNFKKWNEDVTDPEKIRQQSQLHIDPLLPGAKDDDLLTEILLKRGISPLANIEQRDGYVFVPGDNLTISLTRQMTQELFSAILAANPTQIILLDTAFRSDVNLKTNLTLQAQKQNITVEVL